MEKLSVKDIPLKGKKVLMRVDFNVPLTENFEIVDDSRIQQSLESIKYILKEGGLLILMSHLGRPKGKKDPNFSLYPCAQRLSELLKIPVHMAPDCIGDDVKKLVAHLHPNEILLLENLRFYEAEEHPDKDPSFAENLAKLGDIYVNDAFGTAHRSHSSTATITNYFPKKSCAGFLLEKEIHFLNLLLRPKRPFFAIIGGAKVSTKVGVLINLIDKVDALFIGGAMAYTFLQAQKIPIGNSPFEEALLQTARDIVKKAQEKKVPIYFPSDFVIADKFSADAQAKTVSIKQGIEPNWQGMDIGPKTVHDWATHLHGGATIFWNGPLGVYEFPQFAKGTQEIAKILADSSAITIVGGGDSVAAVNALGLDNRFSHLSTGGGASLEYIEFGHLPGIDALTDAPEKIGY